MGKIIRSVVFVRLSVVFTYLLSQLTLNLDFACVWVITTARWGIEGEGPRSRSKVNAEMSVLHEYLVRRENLLTAVVGSRFPV